MASMASPKRASRVGAVGRTKRETRLGPSSSRIRWVVAAPRWREAGLTGGARASRAGPDGDEGPCASEGRATAAASTKAPIRKRRERKQVTMERRVRAWHRPLNWKLNPGGFTTRLWDARSAPVDLARGRAASRGRDLHARGRTRSPVRLGCDPCAEADLVAPQRRKPSAPGREHSAGGGGRVGGTANLPPCSFRLAGGRRVPRTDTIARVRASSPAAAVTFRSREPRGRTAPSRTHAPPECSAA